MNFNGPFEAEGATETDRAAEQPSHGGEHHGRRGRLILLGAAVVLAGALTAGAWTHLTQYRLSADAAEQERDFVPQVSVASVESSGDTEVVKLPATTSAFASANIFARASGYIAKREVDIGDRVKQGQLLVEIVAPELDHQIAQAEATLGQLKWALQQAEANRELVKVTWDRDKPLVQKGWVTAQQGTIDEQTLKAQEAAVSVAQANVTM
jgi:multidrug efflux pump subunit AcrA (membrane-fusion protein)